MQLLHCWLLPELQAPMQARSARACALCCGVQQRTSTKEELRRQHHPTPPTVALLVCALPIGQLTVVESTLVDHLPTAADELRAVQRHPGSKATFPDRSPDLRRWLWRCLAKARLGRKHLLNISARPQTALSQDPEKPDTVIQSTQAMQSSNVRAPA